MPIVTGFDGIYDPHNGFKEIMQARPDEQREECYSDVYRTSLGRGGSDLTATFLGLALDAEYVGFCKETLGVLTGDDMLVGKAARTVRELDYDLATEAGNIYSRAVEPVRAGGIPVHIFDPAHPEARTVVSNVALPAGLYTIERPFETVNIHAGTIPDEPGSLIAFLEVFAEHKVNVEEIRHQRSGTDCIVRGDEGAIQKVVQKLNGRGLRPQAHFTWYLRVVGNVTEDLASKFNDFMTECEPLTLATYQIGTKVLTATVARNRAGAQLDEMQRIEQIVQRIHDEFVVPTSCPEVQAAEPDQLLTTA
jgi:aspartokinase